MKQSEQQLVKAIGVMLWLNNALDDITTDANLKYIVKHDLKMLLNRSQRQTRTTTKRATQRRGHGSTRTSARYL